MNSLERHIATLRGEKIDRISVSPIVSHQAAVEAGEPMTKVAYNPELMADVLLRSLNKHGYDSVRPIGDCGLGTECMGSKILVRDWEQTVVINHGVKSPEDLKKLKVPNPLQDGRMPIFLECQRILVDSVGDIVEVGGGITGPLSFAGCLRGTMELLKDLRTNPEFVHELVRISYEAGKAFGVAQIQNSGVKSINLYEPFASLVSNPMADEFSFHYLEQLICHLKNLGATVLLHICQDSTRLLNRMVEIGADILSLDVEVDLGHAKEIVAGRASIQGNVSSMTLATKQPEDVYSESCQCIQKAGTGGKFILSSACEVPIDTPPENLDAMLCASKEFSPKIIEEALTN